MSSSEATGARESFSERFQVPQLPLISMQAAKSQLRRLVSKGGLPCMLLATLLRLAQPSHVSAQGPPDQATNSGSAVDRAASHSISGTLLDPSGAAIVKADVYLLGAKGDVLSRTTTDDVGAFRFDNIAPGKYMLEFHAEGFRDASVAAMVTNKRFAPIRMVMQISVDTENVTVATGINVPLVSTETSENQNANAIDRDALDRVADLRPGLHHDHVPLSRRQRDRDERRDPGGQWD